MINSNWTERRLLAVAVAAIFVVAVLANLSMSLLHGHLAMVPIYDDVNYMADALVRLRFDAGSGLRSLVRSFAADPPHAPITTLTGILGFGLLGPEPIAAYIANLWVLLVFLVFVTFMTRPLESWIDRALIIATFLFVPVVHAMVMEFRPDLPGGLFLGIAAYLICQTDIVAASHRRRVGLALLCLAATIIKPTAFIIVVPGLALAALVTLFGQLVLDRGNKRATFAAFGEVLGVYALAMVPFVILWGRLTADYVYAVLFTDADVWATAGDRAFHLLYHSTGVGGVLGLGKFFRNGMILILIDLALTVWRRAPRDWRTAAYYFVVGAVYVAMAMSGEKTPYQGSFFYIPFVIAFTAAAVRIILVARESVLDGAVRPALIAILALYAWQYPLASYYYGAMPDSIRLPPIVQTITERLVAVKAANLDNPACSDRPLTVIFTDSFPIPTDLVRFEAAKVGVHVVVSTTFMTRSFEEMKGNADRGDLILIADPTHRSTSRWLPGLAFNPELFAFLDAQKGWARFDVGGADGKPQWLFVAPHCNPPGAF